MTVSNQSTFIWYNGNNSNKTFAVPFAYNEGEESVIKVKLYNATDPTSFTEITLVEGSDYSIDSSAFPNTQVLFTVAPSSMQKIHIYRETENVQNTDVSLSYKFPSESMQEYMDRIVLMIQEVEDTLGRALVNSSVEMQEGNQITMQQLQNTIDSVDDLVAGSTPTTPTVNADNLVYITNPLQTIVSPNVDDFIILTNNVNVTINLPSANAGDKITIYSGSDKDITVVGNINGETNYMRFSKQASYNFYSIGSNQWVIR